jgi:hypothetical protein
LFHRLNKFLAALVPPVDAEAGRNELIRRVFQAVNYPSVAAIRHQFPAPPSNPAFARVLRL